MKNSAIQYRHPWLYSLGIKFLYFDALKILKDMVGKGKKVFEPACGYGRVKNYLYSCCNYSGIDLNKYFVDYGKRKGRDIKMGDILDRKSYKVSDIVILCDILHHLSMDKMKKLVSIATKYAKEKVVIIEPLFVDVASKKNIFSRFLANVFSRVDNDGINKISTWLSKEDYDNLFQELNKINNFVDMKIQVFRRHCFVEFIVKS